MKKKQRDVKKYQNNEDYQELVAFFRRIVRPVDLETFPMGPDGWPSEQQVDTIARKLREFRRTRTPVGARGFDGSTRRRWVAAAVATVWAELAPVEDDESVTP